MVAEGWAFPGYGTRIQEASEEASVWHTVALTKEGQLLLAVVRDEGTVIVEGEAGGGVRSGLQLGPLVGSPNVIAALNKQFPERGPVVGVQVFQTPYSYMESPQYDPMFDYREAHVRKLGEAMVRTLRDLGAH